MINAMLNESWKRCSANVQHTSLRKISRIVEIIRPVALGSHDSIGLTQDAALAPLDFLANH